MVSYAVTEVKRPAPLPTDFQQNIAETTDEGSGYRTVHDRGDDERHEAEADADVPCAEGTESCQNDLESDKN